MIGRLGRRVASSSLLRDAGWMMAGQCLGYILQAVYFVVVARLLGITEYGVFVGAFAFVNLVGRYSTVGTGSVFLRYVSINKSLFANYWGNMLLMTALGGTVMTIVLHLVGVRFLNTASAALVWMAAIANCFGMQVMMCAAQIFQTMGRMKVTALLNLLTNFLRTVAATVMLLILHHATARQWTYASTVISILGAAIAVGTVVYHFHGPSVSLTLLRTRVVEGFEFAFASSTTSAYNDLDKAMLSHYGMNAANGLYTLAYRAVDIATMPIVSLRDAAMPKLYRLGAESLPATAKFAKGLWRRSFPVALAMSACMFLCAPVVPLIAGHEFIGVVAALRWLCLIPVFRSVHEITGSALTGAGLQRYRTATQFAAVMLNCSLNLWLIPSYGWRGAASASLITDALLGVMNWTALELLLLSGKGASHHQR